MAHEKQGVYHDRPESPLPDPGSEAIVAIGHGTIDAAEAAEAISGGFYSHGYVLSSEASVDA